MNGVLRARRCLAGESRFAAGHVDIIWRADGGIGLQVGRQQVPLLVLFREPVHRHVAHLDVRSHMASRHTGNDEPRHQPVPFARHILELRQVPPLIGRPVIPPAQGTVGVPRVRPRPRRIDVGQIALAFGLVLDHCVGGGADGITRCFRGGILVIIFLVFAQYLIELVCGLIHHTIDLVQGIAGGSG